MSIATPIVITTNPSTITTGSTSTYPITSGSTYTITGTGNQGLTAFNTPVTTTSTIQVGNHVLSEDKLGDMLALVEAVNRLDKSNPMYKKFMAIKIRNKLKGENT